VKIHVCYHISYVNNHTALLVGQLLGQAYFSEFDFHILDTTAYSDCVYQLVLTNACTRRCHMLPVVVKVKVCSGGQKGRQNAHIFTRISVYRWQS